MFKDTLFPASDGDNTSVKKPESKTSKGKPGKTEDLAAVEDFGKATLVIKPAGAALVKITDFSIPGVEYKYLWNGKGEMILENAPAGKYKTHFENVLRPEEQLSGTFFEIKSGTECTFTLDVERGEKDWREDC